MTPVNPKANPKRMAIVEAASRVFAEHGLARARMADIATAADVGKGTVYEYFKSKEDLVYAVLELHDAQTRAAVLPILDTPGSPKEKLALMFKAGARAVREHLDSQPMYLDFWAASRGGPREGEFTDFVARNYRSWRDIVAATIRDGQESGDFRNDLDPDDLAITIVAAFDGIGLGYYFERTIDIDQVIKRFLDVLCTGICQSTTVD